MPGLVIELERAAMDKTTPESELLRMAKVIAVKLRLPEAMNWIDAELKGYQDATTLPQYRFVRTHVSARNPYYGWQDVNIQPEDLRDAICNQQLFESVSVIESLLDRLEKEGGTIGHPLNSAADEFIRKQMPVQLPLQAQIDPSAFHAVLSGVRTRVLEWALDLEQRGVVGDGMTFSEGEQQRAQAGTPVNISIGSIGNMAGAIGVHFGDLQVNATQNQGDFVSQVRQFSSATREMLKEAPDDEAGDVRAALAEVDEETNQQQPDEGRIKKALRKVAATVVGLGTYAAQAAITAEIGKLLASK